MRIISTKAAVPPIYQVTFPIHSRADHPKSPTFFNVCVVAEKAIACHRRSEPAAHATRTLADVAAPNERSVVGVWVGLLFVLVFAPGNVTTARLHVDVTHPAAPLVLAVAAVVATVSRRVEAVVVAAKADAVAPHAVHE
jgi:hypothetical protein